MELCHFVGAPHAPFIISIHAHLPHSTRHMLRTLGKLVPVCFVLGASMELFMVKTGFYDIGKEQEQQD